MSNFGGKLLENNFGPWIGNQLRVASPSSALVNTRIRQLINPYTGKLQFSLQETSPALANEAINLSRQTLDRSGWSRNPQLRRKVLWQLADALERNREELAILESLNVGKPVRDSRYEIGNSCVEILKYYAGFADKLHGHSFSQLHGGETAGGDWMMKYQTIREPFGLCALITSYNYPLLLAIWKMAPALACGNAVILKPHPLTPISTLKMGELLATETDLPPNIVQILPGGAKIGELLTRHPTIDKCSFTGSPLVGRKVLHSAADTNFKQVTLELGGKSPLLVFPDANLDQAIDDITGAIFANSGQNCCAGSRLLLHKDIYRGFLEKFKVRINRITMGDPLDERTEFGPLVDAVQFKRVQQVIEKSKQRGLQTLDLHHTNNISSDKELDRNGYFFIPPTVFLNVPDQDRIACEEIFGPVLSVLKPFATEKEAVERANRSEMGLAAGLWSSDLGIVERVTHRLQAGTVWVNCYNSEQVQLPFRGLKQSGFGGCDLGQEAVISEFSRTRAVMIRIN